MANETIEILKLLIGSKGEPLSIRKISQIRKINYKSAYNALKTLDKEGVASLQRMGNSINCSFNDSFNDMVFEAEYLRRKDLFKNRDFLVIFNKLSSIKSLFVALLFGSWAKGTASKGSDMDVLTVGGDEKEIQSDLSLLPNKIHLTSISYDEFLSMAKSKEFSVVLEAMKNNIILIGIEDYYRMIGNARQ
ncbi:MAG: nucleotidyltransferase domain-containing protein [Candidatus Aenigmatarchaeota archaeon]